MSVVFLAPLLAAALMFCPAKSFAGQSSRGSESDELKQEPKQTRRLFESALRLEKEGQTAAALAAYGELIQQAPAHWNGLRHRGQLLLQSGQLDAASHDLSAVLVAHPEDGPAWSSYGDCMLALRRDKDAAGAYLKAIENGFNSASVNRKRGDALASVGENEAALESYSTSIKLRLDDPESYFVRGMLLIRMKRDRDATEDFTRAIDFNPDYAEAYFSRGRAWGELSQFASAVRDLNAFLRLKPGDGQALGFRGAALDTLGRVEEALADYAGALKADPTNSRVLMARAELYSRLSRHADALADRDRAIILDPLNAYFWMARGGTQLALGNAEKAIADRTRAVELAPANALMWYSRATIYSALGQSDKALNDAVEALRHNPGFEAARRLIDEIQASGRLKGDAVLPAPAPQHPMIQPGTPAKRPATSGAINPPPAMSSDPVVRSSQQTAVIASLATPAPPIPQPAKHAPEHTVEPTRSLLTPRVAERAMTPANQSPQQLYKQGRELLQHGEFSAASAKLAQATALDPTDPQIWNGLGYSRMRQKHYKEALAALDKAIALKPRYQNALENRSAVRHILGDGSGSARDRIQAMLLAKHR
jgi:tetratricopeptide (TPR) repeat protein